MGFMDKLKNIFFEEEEEDDEIEEKVSQPKEKKEKKKEKKSEKEETVIDYNDREKPKETIAKKIEIPKRTRVNEREEIDKIEIADIEIEEPKVNKVEKIIAPQVEVKPKRENKINTELIFDDEDFSIDVKPKIVKEKSRTIESKDVSLYRSREVKDIKKVEIKKEEKNVDYVSKSAYVKKEEPKTKTFTPSPIISPIYGILDKNYKKEEVKENKEIRISSRPSRMDLDSVRNKAFGDLEYDLMSEFKETEDKEIKKNKEEIKKTTKADMKKIYNSSDKEEKPAIEKVTIGEADEYYNDLGLAYNTDYKDLSKELSDGKVGNKNQKKEDKLEDNLFDLIESMYDREE